MMQALVKGGQSKYSDHCCSFMIDIAKIVLKVPTLPEDLDVAIVRAKTTDNTDHPLLASNDTFHVKRERPIDNLPHIGKRASKESEGNTEGLQPKLLLMEGAKVMLTRNLWTA
jgi:hypothetical protein